MTFLGHPAGMKSTICIFMKKKESSVQMIDQSFYQFCMSGSNGMFEKPLYSLSIKLVAVVKKPEYARPDTC